MEIATQRFHMEHIVPFSKGGESNSDNLALVCNGCNNHKYNRIKGFDKITSTEVPLFHPRQQLWGDHFAWETDMAFLIGLTATGRSTIHTLQLNRPELVSMRRILIRVHLHPPNS